MAFENSLLARKEKMSPNARPLSPNFMKCGEVPKVTALPSPKAGLLHSFREADSSVFISDAHTNRASLVY